MATRVITKANILQSMKDAGADLTPFKNLKSYKCVQYGDEEWVLDSEVWALIMPGTPQMHPEYNYLAAWGYIYDNEIAK